MGNNSYQELFYWDIRRILDTSLDIYLSKKRHLDFDSWRDKIIKEKFVWGYLGHDKKLVHDLKDAMLFENQDVAEEVLKNTKYWDEEEWEVVLQPSLEV